MGTRGPIPKRSDQGHRTNQAIKRKRGAAPEPSGFQEGMLVDPATGVVRVGPMTFQPDPEWHHISRMIWDAAVNTPGVMRYYQPTDLAVLYTTCDDLSYYKEDMRARHRVPAAALASINSLLTSLMLTEGDRRRVQVELTNSGDDKALEASRTASQKVLEGYLESRR